MHAVVAVLGGFLMILTIYEYNEIVNDCRILIDKFQLPNLNICEKFQIEYDAMSSICNQIYIRQTKRITPLIEQDLPRISQVRD